MLEINLDFIKTQALKLEDENWEFRSYLKWRSPKDLDQIAAELYREIAAQIDCCSCGNCCRQLQPSLKDPDIARLAKATGLSKDEFLQQYVERRTEEPPLWLKALPCPFLEDNRCRYYQDRPKSCADYPFLTKKGLVFRLIGVVENLRICPIVFHVNERLKRVTGFRFKPKGNFSRS